MRPRLRGIAARARAGARRYLDGLNAEQREAIEAIDGPLLVLAGAGTGQDPRSDHENRAYLRRRAARARMKSSP